MRGALHGAMKKALRRAPRHAGCKQLLQFLKRDVVVRDPQITVIFAPPAIAAGILAASFLSVRVRRRLRSPIAVLAVFRTAEQHEVVDDDDGLVLLLAGLFVFPGLLLKFAFDEELRSFLHVIAHDLGGPLEGDEIMPLRMVDPLIAIFAALCRSTAEVCNGCSALCSADLGILADIAEQSDFVDSFWIGFRSCVICPTARRGYRRDPTSRGNCD